MNLKMNLKILLVRHIFLESIYLKLLNATGAFSTTDSETMTKYTKILRKIKCSITIFTNSKFSDLMKIKRSLIN